MLTAKLIQLIETHAGSLTRDALKDLATNPRTSTFHLVPPDELEERVSATYRNLGRWVGDPSDEAVQHDYEEWGRRRFRQGIPLSEIVWALVLIKRHLGRFVRDHGLVESLTDRPGAGEFLPVHLQGIQELNAMVGDFFDRAMYYLARGYEAEATRQRRAVPA